MSSFNGSKIWPNFVLVASISCILAVLIAVFGVRGEILGFRTAVSVLTYTVQVAVVVLLAAVVVFVLYASSRKKAIIAVLITLIPIIGIMAAQPKSEPTPDMVEGKRPAPLNDVSTDTVNPPLYDAVATLRPAKSNTLVYPGEKAASLQAKRFPSIAPINTELSTEKAFELAMSIVSDNGWEPVFNDINTGMIEAVVTSLVFNFKDDVVIRVTENGTGSIVDIRSHSRIGRGDMNANGKRVMAFIAEFNKQATSY